MLKTLVSSFVVGAVRQGTGEPEPSALATVLLTTGASLLLARGRRPVGLALVAVGGFLLWRERAAERAAVSAPLPHGPASEPVA